MVLFSGPMVSNVLHFQQFFVDIMVFPLVLKISSIKNSLIHFFVHFTTPSNKRWKVKKRREKWVFVYRRWGGGSVLLGWDSTGWGAKWLTSLRENYKEFIFHCLSQWTGQKITELILKGWYHIMCINKHIFERAPKRTCPGVCRSDCVGVWPRNSSVLSA